MTARPGAQRARLRPIERRVLRLTSEGVPTAEIARRFRREPATIERVREMSELHADDDPGRLRGDVLTAMERRILRWRADGLDHATIATMFRRSPSFVRRVEQLARGKLERG
ncbi:MAG: hypothetical protein AB7H43_03775 [Acidimicrobiia bacterium]